MTWFAAAVALAILVGVGSASRSSHLTFKVAEGGELPVHLIVARHALSCTNIIEKWSGGLDFLRGMIEDPMLSGMGEKASAQAGEAVQKWLGEEGLSVDAVLASVLRRSMETALLMLPAEAAKGIDIAPFIQEHASGYSNSPAAENSQEKELKKINPLVKLDYRWTNKFGKRKGEWADFIRFLQDEFLPSLLQQRASSGIDSSKPIVLFVVSHSKFLAQHAPEFADKCKGFWEDQGLTKPENNQVFSVQYAYKFDRDGFPSVLEAAEGGCREVFKGSRITDAKGVVLPNLCVADIGDHCLGPVTSYSFRSLVPLSSGFLEKTVEADFRRKLGVQFEEMAAVRDWARRLDCPTDGDYDACAKRHDNAEFQAAVDAWKEAASEVHRLRNLQCISGGKPDMKALLRAEQPEAGTIRTGLFSRINLNFDLNAGQGSAQPDSLET